LIVQARKFLRRPAADRRLLVQALLLHACVATLLRLVRFGRLNRWLRTNHVRPALAGGRSSPVDPLEAAPPAEMIAVERVVWAVRQATAVMPWGRTCLTEALTMSVMLRTVGCETTVQYGVPRDDERGFTAHAWLERNGAVVGRSTSRPYVALRHSGRIA